MKFNNGIWNNEIMWGFYCKNYTPYDGDEGFSCSTD